MTTSTPERGLTISQRGTGRRPVAAPSDGRRGALTRDQVLTAALAIIDESGVEALTMRRLGQALHCDPMAVYRHAGDKDAVIDGVLEQVAAQVMGDGGPNGPGSPGQGWEQTLVAAAHSARRLALAHPRLVPVLASRPMARPLCRWPLGLLRLLEQLLEVFADAGFDARGALHATRLFVGFLHGHLVQELQHGVDNPDETDDVLRYGLHRLPITEFPRVRSLATVIAAYDGAAELDEGLAVVLAGLRRQLAG